MRQIVIGGWTYRVGLYHRESFKSVPQLEMFPGYVHFGDSCGSLTSVAAERNVAQRALMAPQAPIVFLDEFQLNLFDHEKSVESSSDR